MVRPKSDFQLLKTFDESLLEPLHELQIEGDPSFVGGLIADYLSQVVELNGLAQAAQKAGQAATLEKTAHKLKSSSAVLGLEKLAAICLTIEERARAGEPTEHEVVALGQATAEAVVVLKSFLQKIGASA